mmetsp:Transcript_45065/g.95875  ORF Transcript_45065/g.95875 Transcript_45065/m.95875 type:complete len:381 (-) Transcript_45065:40-1182(-)
MPRRGGHPAQQRGREVHGTVRAQRQGPGEPRRRQQGHDHGDPRGQRRGSQEGSHLPSSGPPACRAAGGKAARNLGDGRHLRRGGRDEGAHPGVAHRALQHGGHPHQPPGRGHQDQLHTRRNLRIGRGGPRALRCRRGRISQRPWGQSPRSQLAPGHRCVRARLRESHRGDRKARRCRPGRSVGRGDGQRGRPGQDSILRGRHAHRRDPIRDAAGHAGQGGRLPHGGTPGGGKEGDRRGGPKDRRRQGHRQVPGVEHRPRRDARASQPPGLRRHHHALGGGEEGEPGRARARGLPEQAGRRLDEAHAGVLRREGGEDEGGVQADSLLHAGRGGVQDGAAGGESLLMGRWSALFGWKVIICHSMKGKVAEGKPISRAFLGKL